MIRNFLFIAVRSLMRSAGYSAINIAGLTLGMAVSMLIGLWAFDELTFNTCHQNYRDIARIYENKTSNQEINTRIASPLPLADELRSQFKDDFVHVVTYWWESEHTVSSGEQKTAQIGTFMDPEGLEMLSFKMKSGSWRSLDDPASIVLSASAAKAMFGDQDPINKMLQVDNTYDLKVTGVFEDVPQNSDYHDLKFVGSWKYWISNNFWLKAHEHDWNYDVQTLVQFRPGVDKDQMAKAISGLRAKNISHEQAAREKPELFPEPLANWHLYSEWKNGKHAGGRIEFVWLFSIIGGFVLVLACINFMNLSTARSEKRAREVGIRKTIGSARIQLITRFLSESLLVTVISFMIALALVAALLPSFNLLSAKEIQLPLYSWWFWVSSAVFILITGLLAGSYPALYLSSFEPVRVLKGTFQAGRSASLPRKALVVIQFTVSITLIAGTTVVWQQVQYVKDRPIGYSREGLIMIRKNISPDFWRKTDLVAHELRASGAITELAEASNPATEVWFNNKGFNWKGKDPNFEDEFVTMAVTHDYGKTVGWHFVKGRDFSRDHKLDSSGMVLNEAAAKYMGLDDPVDEEITWNGKTYHIIGVIQDMIMTSPFDPVKQTVFFMDDNQRYLLTLRLNPAMPPHESLEKVSNVFKALMPSVVFSYNFADEEYTRKFAAEERIGKLSTLFAGLAILISCLGLFGMASFVAEQRRKEIGIRKVLGATVPGLWRLLSFEFIQLVALASLLGVPLAWSFLSKWLEKYAYHTPLSVWVFVITGGGALLLTLLVVSYQTLRASTVNPVQSLRSE